MDLLKFCFRSIFSFQEISFYWKRQMAFDQSNGTFCLWLFKKFSSSEFSPGLFLFMAIILGPFEGIAQSQINGKILDTSGKPVAYANVLLMSASDSSVIKGSVSQENGSFYFNELDNAEFLSLIHI